jgi:hypothetical protein
VSNKNKTAVAEVVSRIEDPDIRRQVALDFALWFSTDVPNFDVQRFLRACMLTESKNT